MSKSHRKVRMPLVASVFALLLAAAPCAAQILEEVTIVDSPTAGVLPHRGYLLYGSVGPQSSLLFAVKVGLFDRTMLGLSYGLQRFIGRGEVDFNAKVGFEVRLRLIEESESRPAVALGIDTQGEDAYFSASERYERKSKGFYAVFSKNYRLIDDFSIHGGMNYSLENKDEGGVNAFAGLEIGLISGFSLLLDYNPALDDDDSTVPFRFTRGRGYLDAGARIDYHDNLRFKILFKDLLGNYAPEKGVSRSIEVFYINAF